MASGSSKAIHSTSEPLRRYDVFLSFRGDDTRKGFTDHLYYALHDKGILVFRDDEELKRGEYISEKLLQAIQESEYAVVIISNNYAFSKWCLIELTEIVKCKRNKQLTILPIFYHVDPANVRKQKENFINAFAKHRQEPQVNKEQWRDALTEVGNIIGWHVNDSHESTIVQKICWEICNGLSHRLSINFKDVLGIESQVKEIMILLRGGATDVRSIGICGMGGIGKTTLANVIFEMVYSEFEASCFVDDVSEEVRRSGIVNLQRQLISKILKDKDIEIWNRYDGIRVIANRFQRKKVFIVLDNIDNAMQIEALAASSDWFGEGSRILLTSRDNHLLKRFVDETYEVNGLSENDALQLFCLKAFKKNHPTKNYENLSKKFVDYAQGLPLALEVFGSLLVKKELPVWESTLKQLKKEPHIEILDKLKISFDILSNSQKELFLDIACFFYWEVVDNVIQKLESLGRYPKSNIEVLRDKSLIKVSHKRFYMHDLLREMGQHIVREKPLKDPGEYSRLWCWEDFIHVLKNDTGTNAVEAIILYLPLPKPRQLSFEGFSKMKKLKILIIGHIDIDEVCTCNTKTSKCLNTIKWHGNPSKFIMSNELRILEWWGYPLEFLPTNFNPHNLVEFKMPISNIIQLWDATKNFEKLKYIDLRDAPNFAKMPDLSGISSLEKLNINGTAITQLSASTILPKKLNELDIGSSCSRPVAFLPYDLPFLFRLLKKLNLSYCNISDETLPYDFCCSSLLKDLNLSGNNFTRMGSISQLSKIKNLSLKNCSRLKFLPPKLPLSLRYIGLEDCPSLIPISDPRDLLTSSEMLVAGGIAVKANYFGSGRERDGATHIAQPCIDDDFEVAEIHATISWGPGLTSDIPKWFNQRSIPEMFRFDFDVNVHLLFSDTKHFWVTDSDSDSDLDTDPTMRSHPDWDSDSSSDAVSDLDLAATNFYDEIHGFDGKDTDKCIHSCWGYALFIVYEVFEHNSCQTNSSSTTFPVFVCELQVNNEDNQRVPKKCRGTSPKIPLAFRVPEIPSAGRNGIWVFLDYGCFANVIRQRWWYYIGSCSITISSPNVEVKECGGRLVLKHDRSEFHEIIRSISPHGSGWNDVIRSISPRVVPNDIFHMKTFGRDFTYGGPIRRKLPGKWKGTKWITWKMGNGQNQQQRWYREERLRSDLRIKERKEERYVDFSVEREGEDGVEISEESEEESEDEEGVEIICKKAKRKRCCGWDCVMKKNRKKWRGRS